MGQKNTVVLLTGLAFAIAVGAVIFALGAGGNGLNVFAGVFGPTATPKPGTDGSLSGVYDALVHPNDKSVGLHHCIMRIDHDAGDDRAKGAAVCYIDTPGLNPGSDLPEFADGVPGPPPPPPYTTSAPTKLEGSYDSGTGTLTLAGCWSNIGGSLGPNAILEITVPNAKASLPDLEGSVVIYGQQSIASCDTATPKGPAPGADSLNLTRATAGRDFDSDGCTDSDELSKPGPASKCGDDPYNPQDSDDDVTGTGSLLVTVVQADVCQGGTSAQPTHHAQTEPVPDLCAGENGTPDGGTSDDLPDGTVIGGNYFQCITDTIGTPDVTTYVVSVFVYCYSNNPLLTVNCQEAAGSATNPCAISDSACDPPVAGGQDPSKCGDGLPGSSAPGPFGDVDDEHTVLTGSYDPDTNTLTTSGCFDGIENALLGPAIWSTSTVNGQTGQGTVDIWTQQAAGCPGGEPVTTPDFDNAPIETVEQPDGWDTDLDNCSDATELRTFLDMSADTGGTGSGAGAGGLRDPFNRWDWFDQWINGKTDGSTVIGDIGAVVARFGSVGTPGDPKVPPASPVGYDTQADRGGALAGSAGPWNLKPPDGAIVVGDIGATVGHFGHAGCSGKNP